MSSVSDELAIIRMYAVPPRPAALTATFRTLPVLVIVTCLVMLLNVVVTTALFTELPMKNAGTLST